MSVTLRDCLKLPSLSLGRVIAGHGGLDNIVATVSVMEFDDEEEEDFVTPNELLISALYCVKDDVQAQCRMLRQCKNNGDVGLVLFYADMILGSVDERLIELADLLNFPIILLPGKNMGLKYSDVIDDVMEAVFYDQRANRYFISSAMERLAQTVEEKRTPSMLLRYASDYARASFFLCDKEYHIIAHSFWPASNSGDLELARDNFAALLEKKPTDTAGKSTDEAVFFRTGFTEKKSGELVLCAVSHNDILNSAMMSEVAETLQLFAALWNYNLNLSAKEAVIPALFDGRQELAERICGTMGIDESEYNRLIIAEIDEESREEHAERMLNQLRKYFAEESSPLIADLLGTHIVMLSHSDGQTKSLILEEETSKLFDEDEAIEMYTCCRMKSLWDTTELLRKYAAVREAMKKIYPYRKRFSTEDVYYVLRVLRVFQSFNAERAYYQSLLEPIVMDREADLLKTLSCYLLDARSGLKAASELLFVHRNTVLYRLNKIRSLLGCNLTDMPFAYDIYMAVSLCRLGDET